MTGIASPYAILDDRPGHIADDSLVVPTHPTQPAARRPSEVVTWGIASELRDLTSVAAMLIAGTIVVPLLFSIARPDVFALPKLTALILSSTVALVALVMQIRAVPPLPRWHLADSAAVLFGAWHLAAFITSMDHAQSLWGERYQLQGLVSIALYLTAYGLARVALRTPRALVLLAWSTVVGAMVVSGYAIAQRLGLDPIWDRLAPGGRVFSTIGQPNALGAYLVIALPLTWVLIDSPNRRKRLTGAVAATSIAIATVLTLSRAAYLGAIVALVVIAGFNSGRVRANGKRIARWGAAAVVLTAAAAALSPTLGSTVTAAAHRSSGILDTDIDDSANKHIDLWKVGARIAVDHPVVGTGQETFPLVFPEYSRRVLDTERLDVFAPYRPESPHNVYIATAAGAGLGALAAYLALLVATSTTLIRGAARYPHATARPALVAILAALGAHVVTDAFMTGEVTSSWLMWLLLGAALGPADQLRRGRHAA